MNFRIGNILRELSYSLRRNPSLFIGTLLVIAISLLLTGVSFVVRDAVSNATERWKDGVELIVFMNPESSQVEIDAVSGKLTNTTEIEDFTFMNKEQAYEEFQQLFQESDQIREAVDIQDMPPSFRVVPNNRNAAVVESLADSFRRDPGVFEVVAAIDTIRAIENVGQSLNRNLLVLGLFLLLAATLLIYNTIRTTIFSRRREVEVMRLVGASNWYIRIPFMFEGVLQGLLAGVVTYPGLRLANNFLGSLGDDESLNLFQGLRASSAEIIGAWVYLIIGGVIIGAAASLVALSRYLDV